MRKTTIEKGNLEPVQNTTKTVIEIPIGILITIKSTSKSPDIETVNTMNVTASKRGTCINI